MERSGQLFTHHRTADTRVPLDRRGLALFRCYRRSRRLVPDNFFRVRAARRKKCASSIAWLFQKHVARPPIGESIASSALACNVSGTVRPRILLDCSRGPRSVLRWRIRISQSKVANPAQASKRFAAEGGDYSKLPLWPPAPKASHSLFSGAALGTAPTRFAHR